MFPYFNVIIARLNAIFKVPNANSLNNAYMSDVIGNKIDTITSNANSLYALITALFTHTHHISKVYPSLANGILVTGGLAAWQLGAFAVLVPANTIPNPFDIHFINVEAYSVNDVFELVLYGGPDGSEVEIGRTRFTKTTNAGSPPLIYFATPIQLANTQIKAKLATGSGGDTVTISINYNEY